MDKKIPWRLPHSVAEPVRSIAADEVDEHYVLHSRLRSDDPIVMAICEKLGIDLKAIDDLRPR